MTIKTKIELKESFQTGDIPTEDQFAELIDSTKNNDSIFSNVVNLYDKETDILDGTGINSSGVIADYGTGVKAVKIPVDELTDYTVFNLNNVYVNTQIGRLAYMDADSNIIESVNMYEMDRTAGRLGRTFKTPASTAFVFLNVLYWSVDIRETFHIEKCNYFSGVVADDYLVQDVFNGALTDIHSRSSIYKDLNLYILGNSITIGKYGYSPVQTILNRLEFKTVHNLAVSGGRFTHDINTAYNIGDLENAGDSNVLWNQFNQIVYRVANEGLPAPDVIFVDGGINDRNRTKGTPADVFLGNSTVLDIPVSEITNMSLAVRYLVDSILEEFPNVQIIFAAPLQTGSSSSTTTTVKEICDKIEECCGYMSLSCARQDKEAGIYTFAELKDTNDSVHLTELGSVKVGKYLTNKLKEFIRI